MKGNYEKKLQGSLIDVFQLLLTRNMISFSLIPREGNQALDCLAALASREMGPNSLILESPTPLAPPILLLEAQTELHIQGQPILGEDKEHISYPNICCLDYFGAS